MSTPGMRSPGGVDAMRPAHIDMSVQALARVPGAESVPVDSTRPQEIDLNGIEPLMRVGHNQLLGVVSTDDDPDRAAHAKAFQVWRGPNERGQMEIFVSGGVFDPSAGPQPEAKIPLSAGVPLMIGRELQQPAHSRALGSMDKGVSRNHFALTLQPDGRLTVADNQSTNGTRLLARPFDVGKTAPRPRSAGIENIEHTLPRRQQAHAARTGSLAVRGAVEAPQHESVSAMRNRLKVYEDISHDEDYRAVAEPFTTELARLRSVYDKGVSQIEAKYGHDPEKRAVAYRQLEATYEQYRLPIAEKFEAAIKPHLRKRLKLFEIDQGAAYTEHIRVRRNPQTRWLENQDTGRPIPTEPPRLGAVTLPATRLSSWAGSNRQKQNELTGVRTTSSEHIVDLAAAMLADTWRADKEPLPIKIVRDTKAEMELQLTQPHLKGLRLYKVDGGIHRVAAHRLIDGIDAPVPAGVIVD
jgi:hypothetical protein